MVGNTLYFAANSNSHGTELWKSDGTNEGTQLVKDITPGFSSSNLGHLTAVGSRLFFVAGATDARSLWRSEGTEETTVMVKQIRTGWETNPHLLTAVGNTLFFVADDGTNGFELWKSDGTEAGTVMVKNIMDPLNTQSYFNRSSSPNWLVAYGGYLFFSASDDTDIELWRSDGTDLGTVKLDLAPGNLYGEPSRLTVAGETLYFVASNGVDGKELWKLDEPTGTPEMVNNIGPGSSDPRHLTAVGNLLYFTANDGTHGYELWRSDGTEAGTYMLKDINPTGHGLKSSETYPQIVGVGSTVYFVADDGVRGTELWKTDGTSAGTVLVQEITPGSSGTNFFSMKNIAGKLFFTEGVNSESTELWVLNPSMYFAD